MLKSIINIILSVLMISMLSMVLACAESSGKPANADEVTDNLLGAVLAVDFDRYRSYFAEDLQDQLGTEQEFIEEVSLLKDTYGEHVADSMSYSGVEITDDEQIKVNYSVEFTIMSDVQIQTNFEKRNGETVVIGFLLVHR